MLHSFYQDIIFFSENATNITSFIWKLKEMGFESPYTDPRVVNRGFHPIVFILIGRHAYQRTRSGKQKKRIEDIFRPFPSARGERKLAIILTTRYCFIFLSRIGLAEIRTKVENNSEETKRRNATSAAFNVYNIQVKRMKKAHKICDTKERKEDGIESATRDKGRLLHVLHFVLSWLQILSLLYLRWNVKNYYSTRHEIDLFRKKKQNDLFARNW